MVVVFGIDVSKATSNVAVVNDDTTVWKSKINNDWFGFQELLKHLQEYREPQIVFETTGVYSQRLKRFLDDHQYRYTQLNPLAAKKQLDGLRTRKTDKNDALHLAQTQLIFKRRLTYYQDPVYRDLMNLSRFYQEINADLVSEKNRLHRSVQLTFPEVEQLLSKPTGKMYWAIVQLYPHPDCLSELTPDDVREQIASVVSHHGKAALQATATKLLNLAQVAYPAESIDSPTLEQTRYHAKQVAELEAYKDQIIDQMVQIAKSLPEFEILMSIPGFAEKTAVRLIGELGDIRRFGSSNKLNAYVGIDLRHYESGNFIAADQISKRGNHIARAVLYRAINNIASAAKTKPNHINDFYQRRKKQLPVVNGKPVGSKKVAITAMSRLLRTIYHLVTTSQLYSYDVKRQPI